MAKKKQLYTGNGFEVHISLEEDLAGYMLTIDGETVHFEDITRQQQIKVCNGLAQGYNLFSKFIKEE